MCILRRNFGKTRVMTGRKINQSKSSLTIFEYFSIFMNLLPLQTIERIRSEYTITNFSQIIEELVQNSIDANATKIELEINLSKSSLTIQDNGDGISKQNLSAIGTRFSKSSHLT
jgi:signal transduction histidine kinase